MCDSKDLLVGYLYDELDGSERRTFEAHLSSCVECREETAGLRTTRAQLTQWTPPEPDFAFTIVRRPAVPQPAPRFRISPSWGLAAAALLVVALGAAIANVEVRYGNEGLVVRTGWNHQPAATGAELAAATGVRLTPAEWQPQMDGLNRRLIGLETSTAARAQPVVAADPRMSDAELLRRVHELLGASELRQQRALAKFTQDVTAQRQVDLQAISQSLTRLQNASDAEIKQYRDVALRMGRAAFQQNTSQR